MLIGHSDLFTPHNLKWRVFRKVPRSNVRERIAGFGATVQAGNGAAGVRSLAAAISPVAQIVVDRDGFLEDANERARELFNLGVSDIGRPFQDLAVSYRPADLRSAIETAYEQRRPVNVGRVPFERPIGDDVVLEIDVTPLMDRDGAILGATVVFEDVTELAELAAEHDKAKRELEVAYEELQSTVEELETTNEELQSTNEELETTNEELQATNEELETMNEELHSTNDELETMNTEVGTRVSESDRVNLFLEGILGSLGMGVAVIDTEGTVHIWNAMAQDLWGLREDEVVGRDFRALEIGLPVEELSDGLGQVLDGSSTSHEQTVEARDRLGRDFECPVQIVQLSLRSGEIFGGIVLTRRLAG